MLAAKLAILPLSHPRCFPEEEHGWALLQEGIGAPPLGGGILPGTCAQHLSTAFWPPCVWRGQVPAVSLNPGSDTAPVTSPSTSLQPSAACPPSQPPTRSPVQPAPLISPCKLQLSAPLVEAGVRVLLACSPSCQSKILKALPAFPMPRSSLISCCGTEFNRLLSLLPAIFSQMSKHKSHPLKQAKSKAC